MNQNQLVNKFNIWKPVEGINDIPFFHQFSDGPDQCFLIIEWIEKEVTIKKMKISFPKNIAYRVIDEGKRLRNDTIFEHHPDNKSWCFYKTSESDFIAWVNDQNYEIDKGRLTHFLIKTQDQILDIIQLSDEWALPKCEWIK
ncbi:MAG: hypothetical protein AAF927_02345 [Bacteroidota bacterium]